MQWEPVSEYDGEKFPSLIISTAALRPDLNEEEEPDPCLPGDPFGLLGISTSFPGEGTEIKLTIKENEVFGESVWKGTLEEEAGYWIAPTVNWKHRSPAPR